MKPEASKVCVVCGRSIVWRRKWARDWDEVRYCSRACRRQKLRPIDQALEAALPALLRGGPRGATITPSDAVQAVHPGADQTLREPARRAARRLVAQGIAEIVQDGRVVDPSRATGPIRLRLADR